MATLGEYSLGSSALGSEKEGAELDFLLAIDGAVFTPYLKSDTLEINDTLGQRSTTGFTLIDTTNSITVEIGDTVIVRNNGLTLFAGTIENYTRTNPTDTSLSIKVSCVSFDQIADRHLAAITYETASQTAGDIVKDLISRYLADDGITEGTIEDGPTVIKAVYNYMPVAQALNEISERAGFAWWIDYNKKLNFVSSLSMVAPFNITDSSRTYRKLTISKKRGTYRNIQFFRAGVDVTDEREENFNGDGTRKTFTLSFPVALTPVVKVDAVTKTVGILGLDEGNDWYWNKNSKEIVQDDDAVAIADGVNLEITYQGFFPIIASAEDSVAIADRIAAEGGSGRYASIYKDESIDSNSMATDKADALLRKFASLPDQPSFETDEEGLRAGQFINITLTVEDIAENFLITSVRSRYIQSAGIFRSSIKMVYGEQLGSWVEFMNKLLGRNLSLSLRENEVIVNLRKSPETITVADDVSVVTALGDKCDDIWTPGKISGLTKNAYYGAGPFTAANYLSGSAGFNTAIASQTDWRLDGRIKIETLTVNQMVCFWDVGHYIQMTTGNRLVFVWRSARFFFYPVAIGDVLEFSLRNNGTTAELYVNGNLIDSSSEGGGALSGTPTFLIGDHPSAPEFDGQIDYMEHYIAGVAIARWDLTDDATDSINSYDLTVSGSMTYADITEAQNASFLFKIGCTNIGSSPA